MLTEPHPWRAAGCLVFRKGTDRVLLLHDPRRGWDLPKGKREPGETPLETALRETFEETGLDVSVAPELWIWIPQIFIFLSVSESEPVIPPNPHTGKIEHDTAGYFPLARASAMLMPSLSPCLSVFTSTLSARGLTTP